MKRRSTMLSQFMLLWLARWHMGGTGIWEVRGG
jgi:hypothetical protein